MIFHMEWIKLLLAFLIANLLGYGGGPASIPLVYEEVVNRYGWMTDAEFSNVLAVGNSLPGPIATKMATYVGYQAAGWTGSLVAVAATVLPSGIALIFMINLLRKFRESKAVKGITLLIQPVIAILMLRLTLEIADDAVQSAGILQSLLIAAVALWALHFRKIHPAIVILAAFVYGGFVLA